ncbi:MFS transporter, partial [Klebsiella pneumoniae]|uniref:MFS transporter n=1 Tax=Klebsiella pneumoniae TaxID=573 RepID=UPI003D2173F1
MPGLRYRSLREAPVGRIRRSRHPAQRQVWRRRCPARRRSKNAYTAAFTSYYTFYLIERFQVSVQLSQLMLFLYLAVGAVGVILGGMLGDRIGRGRVIWLSILGSLPFALALPHADMIWTGILSVVISFVM